MTTPAAATAAADSTNSGTDPIDSVENAVNDLFVDKFTDLIASECAAEMFSVRSVINAEVVAIGSLLGLPNELNTPGKSHISIQIYMALLKEIKRLIPLAAADAIYRCLRVIGGIEAHDGKLEGVKVHILNYFKSVRSTIKSAEGQSRRKQLFAIAKATPYEERVIAAALQVLKVHSTLARLRREIVGERLALLNSLFDEQLVQLVDSRKRSREE